MLGCGDHSLVGLPIICVKARLLPIDQWNSVPQFASALAAAVANLESNDLFAVDINGNPDPLLIRLAANKTPHFIGLGFQA
jgi:hypothetical protein